MNSKKPTGYVIYHGPSQLDGQSIVVIAITGSSNRKTGDMVQTYIMRSDVAPLNALASGQDVSICGDCKHRPSNGGACYVNVGHGPRSVYAAYLRGNYPSLTHDTAFILSLGVGRMVRLGTYGDPAAVPFRVWNALTSSAQGVTGYTHQWKHASALRTLCMASVDSPHEKAQAQALGWRTFRIRADESESLMHRESVCPASEEAGKKLTCMECGACNGIGSGRRGSIAIIVHGAKSARFIQQRETCEQREES